MSMYNVCLQGKNKRDTAVLSLPRMRNKLVAKQAIVVPVPKCRPPVPVESDLRPVSLTSPVAKILEGFSANYPLMCFWDKLDSKQFALPGRSTMQALVYLLHTILESVDGGEMYVRMFFSDFSKGLDLVDHNVLLRELDILDVDPHLVRWIAAFFYEQKPEGEGGGGSVPTHMAEWRNSSRN